MIMTNIVTKLIIYIMFFPIKRKKTLHKVDLSEGRKALHHDHLGKVFQ